MPSIDPSGARDLHRDGPPGPVASGSDGPIRRVRSAWRTATPPRRRLAALAAVLLVASTAMAIWWGLAATVGKVSWRDLAYDVQSDRSVVVSYAVTKPPERSARCVIVAKEVNHGTVGRLEDVIGPSETSTVRREMPLRTTSRAVIGMVDTCRAF